MDIAVGMLYLCITKVYRKMGRVKNIVIGVLVLALAILSIGYNRMCSNNRNLREKYNDAVENLKAYSDQFTKSETGNRAFKITIDQLKGSNDTILGELNAIRKELKVKDSRLRSLQYVGSNFSKVDTIRIPGDTIFKDTNLNIDTLLSDEWYSIEVGMRYPSTVVVQPKFKSEKHIVVSAKRETVNPPKKFFLWRLLQKKQWVMQVDVVEKNPYVQNQTNRYVEIVK